MSWGSGLTGNFRYQLNGVTDTNGYYHGSKGSYLFSASSVVINH
ncbi:hypothetical protein [Agromyces archimandritae]|nr:hypothetical protein [Agromyces archimandritae]